MGGPVILDFTLITARVVTTEQDLDDQQFLTVLDIMNIGDCGSTTSGKENAA